MTITLELNLTDGNCPAGSSSKAQINFTETSTRTNAGGPRMDLCAEGRGHYLKLVTPVPLIGWCNYDLGFSQRYTIPNNVKFKSKAWAIRNLQADKNIVEALELRAPPVMPPAEMVMFDPEPIPPENPPPPAEPAGRLLAVYSEEGVPKAGVPWTAGSESGSTNSLGEVRINDLGPVTLGIGAGSVGELVGDEFVAINAFDLYLD